MWQPPERIKHPLPSARWPTKEEAAASRLFSPCAIGREELSSCTWVPAMVPWRASEDGFVTQDVLDWYGRFAEGRPGAIVVEATGIRDVPSGPLLRAGHARFVPGLKQLVDVVATASGGATKLYIQLIDFLAIRRRPEAQKFFQRFLAITDGHRTQLANVLGDEAWKSAEEDAMRNKLADLDDTQLDLVLSARELDSLRFGYRERAWDMELPHIAQLPQLLPELFAGAARNAMDAGFHGIELHYAHAYTMASFLSARNQRTDEYGGTRENRVRLPVEVIRAVRKEIGGAPTLGLRYLGDEVIAGGNTIEDAVYFAEQFAREEIDFLSISKGGKFEDAKQPKVGKAAYPYTGESGYECMPSVFSDKIGPFARNVPLAAQIRGALRKLGSEIPVVTAGGIATFEKAEEILKSGQADIVASARQAIADPDWLEKIRVGRGQEIRRCEYTNYCEGLDQHHKQVTCKLWDRKDLDDGLVTLDTSGKRRLTAPRWQK